MRKVFCGALLAVSAVSFAQTTRTVTFTTEIDTTRPVAQIANGGTYVPTADKFLSVHPSSVRLYNGADGSYDKDLSIAGITASNPGFHAATATKDGHIYILEADSLDVWRWNSVDDTQPEKVYDTAGKYWYGYTATTGNDITVGFSSPDIDGPATFFSDSFPFSTGSFSFTESAPIQSKMALAFNNSVTAAWAVGDTNRDRPLNKWIKSGGTWSLDPAWTSPRGGEDYVPGTTDFYQGGPLGYDEANDVLLAITLHTYNLKVHAYDGTTGRELGTHVFINNPLAMVRGGGAWATGIPGSGTFYSVTRGFEGTTANPAPPAVNLYKFTYTVTTTSDIIDWSMY